MPQPLGIVPVLPAAGAPPSPGPAGPAPLPVGMQYNGGPIIANAQVVPIFWGSAWSTGTDALIVPEVGPALQALLTSSFMEILAEYSTKSTTIGNGSVLPTVTITTSEPGTVSAGVRSVTDAQIQTALGQWIAKAIVPATTANTIYFIFLPVNVTAYDQVGNQSCINICGYHYFFNTNVYYAIIPYQGCSGCQGSGTNLLDRMTVVASHELAEAITDPNPTQPGWYDPNSGQEIADPCAGTALVTKRLGNILVQDIWSNSRCGCTALPYTGFAPGTIINSTDSTPKALAACDFLQQIFLFWKANDSDAIYFSHSLNGVTWPAGQKVNSVDSTPEPLACCVFNDKLYLFWKSDDSSNLLYFATLDETLTWSPAAVTHLSNHSPKAPACCVFNNTLYLFWKADDGSNAIYFSTSADGNSWTPGRLLNAFDSTPEPLSACVFGASLYLFWKANDPSNRIYFTASFDGQNWPGGKVINTVDSTPLAPSACGTCGVMYLFWTANDSSNSIYVSISSTGISWGPGRKINEVDHTPEPPFAYLSAQRQSVIVFWKSDDNDRQQIYRTIENG